MAYSMNAFSPTPGAASGGSGGAGGVGGGPTPWWTLPQYAQNFNTLKQNTPSGYNFDPVQGNYVPNVGSPADLEAQRARMQGMENTRFTQGTQAFNAALSGLSGLGSSFGATPSFNFGGGTGAATSFPSWNGGGFSGGSTPSIPSTPNPASLYAHPTTPANTVVGGPDQGQLAANNSAIFGQAKDQAAQTAQAAMRGLSGSLAARGMGGAGYEAGQVGRTVSNAADQIGAASRQLAQEQYDQALSRANLQAQIASSERGQDLGAQTTLRGQDLGAYSTLRGQDIGAQTAYRGQDLGAYTAQLGAATSQRAQDLAAQEAAAQLGLTARGQNLSYLSSAMNNLRGLTY